MNSENLHDFLKEVRIYEGIIQRQIKRITKYQIETKMSTSLIPIHKSAVTRRTNTAAHGSTTIPSPGMV
jgi:hypothetical protein